LVSVKLPKRALSEARARAEVATEAKSIFLANMSHEIRTPMNAILGMAYLAMKSGLPPRQHDYVAKIHAGARSLLGILNDILDFSKIEAGKVVLESAPFDLEAVVQNALFMVQQRVESKRIELVLDYRLPRDFPDVDRRSITTGSGVDQPALKCGQIYRGLATCGLMSVKSSVKWHHRRFVAVLKTPVSG
jgi:signal transduction histidine kinase